jgi:hypothetical protein
MGKISSAIYAGIGNFLCCVCCCRKSRSSHKLVVVRAYAVPKVVHNGSDYPPADGPEESKSQEVSVSAAGPRAYANGDFVEPPVQNPFSRPPSPNPTPFQSHIARLEAQKASRVVSLLI